ncbi:MAG: LacI family DNA-binding transcriptional regulator [Actinomycetota bacterium]|nr:LacI family DNA-binding transcriptional regulator [Actinomycetota bacterium]
MVNGESKNAPSMADVAARAGVSHQTVSRVVNGSDAVRGDTRDRVLAAIEELGYRRNKSARALVTRKSGRLGLLYTQPHLYGPGTLAASVHQAGQRAGYDIILSPVPHMEASSAERAIEALLDDAVEAVLLGVSHQSFEDLVAQLAATVEVVMIHSDPPAGVRSVGIDQHAGAVLATQYLLDIGHRNIAHVAGPVGWIDARQRREGWLAALRDSGVQPGPEIFGDWSSKSGYEAGAELARDPSVTAVFAANDSMALGVIRALHEAGLRVPQDVSVVGFDDVPDAAYLWPPLTTVRQDFASLGELAVEVAITAIADGTVEVPPLLAPELVVRSSAAPHPRD